MINLKVGSELDAIKAIQAMSLIQDPDFLEIIEKHLWAMVSDPLLPYPDGQVVTYLATRLQRIVKQLRPPLKPNYSTCPVCNASPVDFRGTDFNPTEFICPNGHEWEA